MNNKKLFYIGVSIVLICWIGNIIYYFTNRVEGMIFMDNYKEISIGVFEIQEDEINEDLSNMSEEEKKKALTRVSINHLNLPYVMDRSNDEWITSVTFPELDNFTLWNVNTWNENNISNYDNLKLQYIACDNESLTPDDKEVFLKNIDKGPITKIVYSTNLDKSYAADIGKVYLVEKNFNELKLADNISSGSGSDGTGESVFNIKEDVNVVSIESNILDEVKKNYDVYINGVNLDKITFPFKVTKAEGLNINYKQKLNIESSFQCIMRINIETDTKSETLYEFIEFNNWIGLSSDIIKNIRKEGKVAYEIGN